MLAEPDLFGYHAGEVAWAVAPRAAALGLMGPVAGYLAARYGGRRMATLGMVLVGVSMLMLASLDAGAMYVWILPGLVVSGIGLGLVGPPSVAAVTNEAASEDLGAAGAAVNLGASFGSSMGIAVMQAVLVATAASAHAARDARLLDGVPGRCGWRPVIGVVATLQPGRAEPGATGRCAAAGRRPDDGDGATR